MWLIAGFGCIGYAAPNVIATKKNKIRIANKRGNVQENVQLRRDRVTVVTVENNKYYIL